MERATNHAVSKITTALTANKIKIIYFIELTVAKASDSAL
jgi:hypothetical protein